MKLPRFTQGPRKAVDTINRLVDLHNNGVVIDSLDIVSERQPDGRVRIRLSPTVRKKLGLPPI